MARSLKCAFCESRIEGVNEFDPPPKVSRLKWQGNNRRIACFKGYYRFLDEGRQCFCKECKTDLDALAQEEEPLDENVVCGDSLGGVDSEPLQYTEEKVRKPISSAKKKTDGKQRKKRNYESCYA